MPVEPMNVKGDDGGRPKACRTGSAESDMQKLVTIYLDNAAYGKGKLVVGSFANEHGLIEEHLRGDLKAGWSVKAIHGFGGNSDGLSVRGWLAVLLEKPSDGGHARD